MRGAGPVHGGTVAVEELLPVGELSPRSGLPQLHVLRVVEYLAHVVARAEAYFFECHFQRHRARPSETSPDHLQSHVAPLCPRPLMTPSRTILLRLAIPAAADGLLLYTTIMPAKVRIKPELITEHRLRIEMSGLEDEDIENTIRMKGWAWVRSRGAWVYAGEPDFIYRQVREVIIGLPDILFEEDGIEESIRSVDAKARSDEEREEGRELLRQAFEKTDQLSEAQEFFGD
jgi:hypothetical protein